MHAISIWCLSLYCICNEVAFLFSRCSKKNVLSFFFLRTVWVTKWIQQLCDYIIGKPFLFLVVPVCFEMSATNWMRYFVFSAFLKCWCNSINKASPVRLFRRFFCRRCTVPLQYMHIQIHLAQPWSFRPRKPMLYELLVVIEYAIMHPTANTLNWMKRHTEELKNGKEVQWKMRKVPWYELNSNCY